LSDKDLALDRSMIPLGSCTMKLNATSEMIPVTWPEFANVHPFAPREQLAGNWALNGQLCGWLSAGHRLRRRQPAAQRRQPGRIRRAAGDPGLARQSRGQGHRHVCLIPESAHGTNPASAQMVGMTVVVVKCDAMGNVDIDDLQAPSASSTAPTWPR
jgi:glycine dehydrogenase